MSQTPQGNQAVVVGLGIILGPAFAKAAVSVAAAAGGVGRIPETAPIKFRGNVRAGLVILAAKSLQRKQPEAGEKHQKNGEDGPHQLHDILKHSRSVKHAPPLTAPEGRGSKEGATES